VVRTSGAVFIRGKHQQRVDAKEAQGVLFEKLHPGKEHNSAPGGLVQISQVGVQCTYLGEREEGKLEGS